MQKHYKDQAIVLHSIRWKESSKIITLFTRDKGILKVIARSVYRPNNPMGGRLESMNLLEIVVVQKQSRSLQILQEAELIDSFYDLRRDLSRLPYALAVLELIQQTLEEQNSDEIFFDFTVYLLKTFISVSQPEIILVYFLLKLSSFLGFKPAFNTCQSCGTKNLKDTVYFSIENGTVLCPDCSGGLEYLSPLREDQLYFLQQLQTFHHKRLTEFPLSPPTGLNAVQLLIRYLSFHLEHTIHLNALSLL